MAAATLEVIIKAVDQASAVIKGIGDSSATSMANLQKAVTGIGVSMAAAGVGLEAFARSQREINVQCEKLSTGLGMTDKAFRELAISARDEAGQSMKEVLDLMTLARKEGVDSADGVKKFAESWDEVADATGGNAVELARAGVSLRAVGIDANNVGKAYSAFGLIQSKTTLGVQTFIDAVGKAAPELNRCGLSVDDAAKAFAFLEQQGITGRPAIAAFNAAMKESDGTAQGVYKQLGMNAQVQGEYNQKLSESGGVIQKNAALYEQSFTPLQKIQTTIENVVFKNGELISSLANLSPILIGVGGGLTVIGQSGILTGTGMAAATAGFLASVPASIAAAGGLTAVVIAAAPLIIAAVAIVGAAALIYTAWTQNWGGIQEKVGAAVSFISDRFKALTDAAVKVGTAAWDGLSKLGSGMGEIADKIGAGIVKIIGPAGMKLLGDTMTLIGKVWDTGWTAIAYAVTKAFGLIGPAINKVVQIVQIIGDKIMWVAGLPGFKQLADLASWAFGKIDEVVTATGDAMDRATTAMNKDMESVGTTATTTATTVKSSSDSQINSNQKNQQSADTLAQTVTADGTIIQGTTVKNAQIAKDNPIVQTYQIKQLPTDQQIKLPNGQTITGVFANSNGTPVSSTTEKTAGQKQHAGTTLSEDQWNEYLATGHYTGTPAYGGSGSASTPSSTGTPSTLNPGKTQTGEVPAISSEAQAIADAQAAQAEEMQQMVIAYEIMSKAGSSTIAQGIFQNSGLADLTPDELARVQAGYQRQSVQGQGVATTVTQTDKDVALKYLKSLTSGVKDAVPDVTKASTQITNAITAASTEQVKIQQKAQTEITGTVTSGSKAVASVADFTTKYIAGQNTAQNLSQQTTASRSTSYITAANALIVGSHAATTLQGVISANGLQTGATGALGTMQKDGTIIMDSFKDIVISKFNQISAAARSIATPSVSSSGSGQTPFTPSSSVGYLNNPYTPAAFTTNITPLSYTAMTPQQLAAWANDVPAAKAAWENSMCGGTWTGFADGGTVGDGGVVVVGENGPEMVNLPGGTKVTPLSGKPDVIDYDKMANAFGTAMVKAQGSMATALTTALSRTKDSKGEVHVHVGGVWDKSSLKALARLLKQVDITENIRTGRSTV